MTFRARRGENRILKKEKLLSSSSPRRLGSRAAQESQKPTVNRVIISGFFLGSFASPFYDSTVLPHLIQRQCVLMLRYRVYITRVPS